MRLTEAVAQVQRPLPTPECISLVLENRLYDVVRLRLRKPLKEQLVNFTTAAAASRPVAHCLSHTDPRLLTSAFTPARTPDALQTRGRADYGRGPLAPPRREDAWSSR